MSRNANIFRLKSYAKQFGTNGASLFILRVCLIGKRRILYAVLQKQNCVKKLFSQIDICCKKFLWE